MDLIKYFFRTYIYPFRVLTHWDRIWILGNQRIIQLTILVPVIGYFIIFSNSFCEFTESLSAIDIGLTCEKYPSWKTYYLYFGFTILALASILFSILCPREVRLYGTAHRFIDAESEIMHTATLKYMAAYIVERMKSTNELPVDIQGLIQKIRNEHGKGESKIKIPDVHGIGNDAQLLKLKNMIMFSFFEYREESNIFARLLVLISYLIGIGLIVSVSYDTLIKVIDSFQNVPT